MEKKHLLMTFMVLAIIALPVTWYLMYIAYAVPASAACDINAQFSCSIVSQSDYAVFLNIPVATWGFLGYLALLILAAKTWKVQRRRRRQPYYKALAILTGIGLIISLYLTYVEFAILQAWCIFCVIQQVIILVMFIVSLLLLRRR